MAVAIGAATAFTAVTGSTIANHVLGQADFFHDMLNFGGPRALNRPQDVGADLFGHLYVVDTINNRVLGYRSIATLTSGAAADIVLGQPDLFSYKGNHGATYGGIGPDALEAPQGVAVDSKGNVYVSDGGNNRVLEYRAPFASCASLPCGGELPSMVFGQNGSFTSGN
jgi:hypothetical protein